MDQKIQDKLFTNNNKTMVRRTHGGQLAGDIVLKDDDWQIVDKETPKAQTLKIDNQEFNFQFN